MHGFQIIQCEAMYHWLSDIDFSATHVRSTDTSPFHMLSFSQRFPYQSSFDFPRLWPYSQHSTFYGILSLSSKYTILGIFKAHYDMQQKRLQFCQLSYVTHHLYISFNRPIVISSKSGDSQ